MEKRKFTLNKIPSILWGQSSSKIFLYLHGQYGSKEGAKDLAEIANICGWQVLSFDLPEHGERSQKRSKFVPWQIVPEIVTIMEYVKSRWNVISLYAESIGAYFSLLSLSNEKFENCLFVSPILDMQQVILSIMKSEKISEKQLQNEIIIPTSSGQILSWNYLTYVRERPIYKWLPKTKILYAEQDELIARSVVEKFAQDFKCELTIIANAKHWFGSQEQLPILKEWINNCLL